MSEKSIKVTDKRKFTAEGALKEEYRFLEEAATAQAAPAAPADAAPVESEPTAAPPTPAPSPPSPADVGAADAAAAAAAPAAPDDGRAPLEIPDLGPRGQAPGFFDLLSVMVEPVPFYLGDAPLPDGSSGENLEAARFYIDLLDLLREKTAGNLTLEEADALQDVLYRLRLRYVQKRG